MNEENPFQRRVSSTETGAVDYKARKRIEELFLLTDELLRERSYETVRYDKKLYKKYKDVKEINKKLQEKLLDYHCSGCQCRCSTNAATVAVPVQLVPSTDVHPDNNENRKLISNRELESANQNVSLPIPTQNVTTDQQDDLIIINEVLPRLKRRLHDENGRLPESLQRILRTSVRTHYQRRNYLMKIGLYPRLCEYLCNRCSDSFYRRPSKDLCREFLQNHVVKTSKLSKKVFDRVADELREIHQIYLLQFMDKPPEDESIGARKRTYQRKAVRNKKQ